jgi:hypothetical protein
VKAVTSIAKIRLPTIPDLLARLARTIATAHAKRRRSYAIFLSDLRRFFHQIAPRQSGGAVLRGAPRAGRHVPFGACCLWPHHRPNRGPRVESEVLCRAVTGRRPGARNSHRPTEPLPRSGTTPRSRRVRPAACPIFATRGCKRAHKTTTNHLAAHKTLRYGGGMTTPFQGWDDEGECYLPRSVNAAQSLSWCTNRTDHDASRLPSNTRDEETSQRDLSAADCYAHRERTNESMHRVGFDGVLGIILSSWKFGGGWQLRKLERGLLCVCVRRDSPDRARGKRRPKCRPLVPTNQQSRHSFPVAPPSTLRLHLSSKRQRTTQTMVVEVPNPAMAPADPKTVEEERTADVDNDHDARDNDGIPDHPAASPELFAAFAALWALTQDVTLAGPTRGPRPRRPCGRWRCTPACPIRSGTPTRPMSRPSMRLR